MFSGCSVPFQADVAEVKEESDRERSSEDDELIKLVSGKQEPAEIHAAIVRIFRACDHPSIRIGYIGNIMRSFMIFAVCWFKRLSIMNITVRANGISIIFSNIIRDAGKLAEHECLFY